MLSWNENAIKGRHTLSYRTRDAHRNNPTREVEVLASPDEIQGLLREGFLLRPSLLDAPTVQSLRDALDECIATAPDLEHGGGTFGGTFLRHLADRHPAFLPFLNFAPMLSVARAVLGPSVGVRGMTARVCRPGDQHSEVEWHHHLRMVPDPLPPLWCPPMSLDALLYLDDITDGNGPLFVVPGSHLWHDRDLPRHQTDNKEEQVKLSFPPERSCSCSARCGTARCQPRER